MSCCYQRTFVLSALETQIETLFSKSSEHIKEGHTSIIVQDNVQTLKLASNTSHAAIVFIHIPYNNLCSFQNIIGLL